MPKQKKASSSESNSDSDSDVRRSPPPKKKAKNDDSDKPKDGFSGKRDKGETTWSLGGNKQVKVRNFKGKMYIDIREYYEKDGELRPGKKGISLTPELYQKFKGLIGEIDEELNRT